jgi:hypothetical protein
LLLLLFFLVLLMLFLTWRNRWGMWKSILMMLCTTDASTRNTILLIRGMEWYMLRLDGVQFEKLKIVKCM